MSLAFGAGPDGEEEQAASWEGQAFERDLTAVLRPLEPPPGFADRMMARAAGGFSPVTDRPRGEVIPFRAWRLAAGVAVAASLLAGTFALQDAQGHRERAKKQAVANQQFQTATRITEQALAHTREQLVQAGALREE